jgi:hypothetical protein
MIEEHEFARLLAKPVLTLLMGARIAVRHVGAGEQQHPTLLLGAIDSFPVQNRILASKGRLKEFRAKFFLKPRSRAHQILQAPVSDQESIVWLVFKVDREIDDARID